jgi:hypothetical protein
VNTAAQSNEQTNGAIDKRLGIGGNNPPRVHEMLLSELSELYSKEFGQVVPIAKRANAAPKAAQSDDDLKVWTEICLDAKALSKALDGKRLEEQRPLVAAIKSAFDPHIARLDRIFTAGKEICNAYNQRKLEKEREARLAEERRLREEAEKLARERDEMLANERKLREEAERLAREQAEKLESERLHRLKAENHPHEKVRPKMAEFAEEAKAAAIAIEPEKLAATAKADDALTKVDEANEAVTAVEDRIATLLSDAPSHSDVTRVRGASGSMATTASTWDFEIVDISKINLNEIRPFIDPKAISAAVGKIVKIQKGATLLAGVRVFEIVNTRFRRQ